MTLDGLQKANQLKDKIDKFSAAKENNFQIKIDNWEKGDILDADLRPETQSKIKQLMIDELTYLEDTLKKM